MSERRFSRTAKGIGGAALLVAIEAGPLAVLFLAYAACSFYWLMRFLAPAIAADQAPDLAYRTGQGTDKPLGLAGAVREAFDETLDCAGSWVAGLGVEGQILLGMAVAALHVLACYGYSRTNGARSV